MRSAAVSIEPNIIVAVVGIPSDCASRITPSHSWGLTLRAEMRLRTRSTRISAPAPGSDFMPASFNRRARRDVVVCFDVRQADDLRHRERMQVGLRILAPHAAKKRFEPFDAEFRIDAALDHDLGRALIDRILDALEHAIVRHGIAFFVVLGPEECAESAMHVADICVVDRRIDDVGDDVLRVHHHATRVRGRAELVDVGFVVEPHALVECEPAAGGGAIE